MSIFNSDFIEYIELLQKHEVEYVLVGGMAVNLHGYRRTTGDMDIFVNPTSKNHNKLNPIYAIGFVMRIQTTINQEFIFEKHSTAMVKKINLVKRMICSSLY